MPLPLNGTDGKPTIPLSNIQLQALKVFKDKVAAGEYKFMKLNCLCGNSNIRPEYVVTKQDRYGIAMENAICEKCGLIRATEILDEPSTIAFYSNEYRSLYGGASTPREDFFQLQQKLGAEYLNKFLKYSNVKDKNLYVFEIGCGAGGIHFPFQRYGFKTAGCDFDERYLEYGRNHGLNLKYGEFTHHIKDEEVDVIILSLVFEHFLDPIKELQGILKTIKKGGYLIFAVPGIFDLQREYINPINFFQNAHIFNFYEAYLRIFFKEFGLEVLYGDEWCKFIIRKPLDWTPKDIKTICDPSLENYPEKIKEYLIQTQFRHKWFLNRSYWSRKVGKPIGIILGALGLKNLIRKLIK